MTNQVKLSYIQMNIHVTQSNVSCAFSMYNFVN